MKYFVTSIFILFAITASTIFSTQYMQHISDRMIDTLNSCESAVTVSNWDDAEEEIAETEALWEKHRPRLSALIMHHNIDDLSETLTRTNALIVSRDKAGFLVESKYLSSLIRQIGAIDVLSFENLF